MKLEIGSGHRPTPGYRHNDINDFEGIDIVGPAWQVDLPDNSLDEVISLGVMEHLSFEHFAATLANVRRMLRPEARFYFDVPDVPVWCGYLVRLVHGYPVPFTRKHIYATLYGWQRWPGDEHKSGWDQETLHSALDVAGFTSVEFGVQHFLENGLRRRRMTRAADAHLYAVATK